MIIQDGTRSTFVGWRVGQTFLSTVLGQLYSGSNGRDFPFIFFNSHSRIKLEVQQNVVCRFAPEGRDVYSLATLFFIPKLRRSAIAFACLGNRSATTASRSSGANNEFHCSPCKLNSHFSLKPGRRTTHSPLNEKCEMRYGKSSD